MKRAESSITQSKSFIGQYAGFISRLTAYVIDLVIIMAVLLFSTWFIAMSVNLLYIGPIIDRLTQNLPSIRDLLQIFLSPIAAGIYTFLLISSYFILFWFLTGQTPGKAFLGVRVVTLSGKKMTLRHAIFRYIGYHISAVLLGLGFFWIIFDNRRMAWHDKLARTCVIYTWNARPDEKFLANALERLAIQRDGIKTLTSINGTPLQAHDLTKSDKIPE